MRLNGWQRIGVIISLAWVFGFGGWGFYSDGVRNDYWRAQIHGQYLRCVTAAESNQSRRDQCMDQQRRDLMSHIREPDWGFVALLLLGPVFAGWFTVYFGLFLFRWVRRGFLP